MAESIFDASAAFDFSLKVEKDDIDDDLIVNSNDDNGKQRKKRRRKARLTGLSQQRRWANERERHRTRRVNDAIYALRDRLPDFLNPLHIKLSKMETICLAIRYIRQLKDMLEEDDRSRSCSDFEGIDTNLSPQLSSDLSTDGDFEELLKMDTSFLLSSSPSSDFPEIDDTEDVFW
ncbi:neurogenic differentiation factor 1-like [Xenia sp. Carnegie-2017]|uniref:neurogenic differentiation factor 1-like n=1 Tax=Xenia sp. Carnegie-2017 TaxID=2897299 RepID=UPI001F040DDB|nr:neurogenic differentiation factor 1-like [Xenia sp. Carnegie-2017]